jgi:hypothetical protein
LEHPAGVLRALGLAEDLPGKHHDGVGPEDDGGAHSPGDGAGLGERQRLDGVPDGTRWQGLGDLARDHVERDAELAQEVGPTGRGRGEDETFGE